jgi:hypothetical protein
VAGHPQSYSARCPGQGEVQRKWRKQQYEILAPLLRQEQAETALVCLQALRPGADHKPIEALEDATTYLEIQRDWIGNYQQWQKAGYPVSSGLVERGVAMVSNPRMKRRGAGNARTPPQLWPCAFAGSTLSRMSLLPNVTLLPNP